MTNSADRRPPLQVVVLTGMAGSGKSVALHALEDIGYYCVDNLPPELLPALVSLEHWQHGNRIAIAIDARSAKALYLVPEQLEKLRATGAQVPVRRNVGARLQPHCHAVAGVGERAFPSMA